jgi:hypothetical protein
MMGSPLLSQSTSTKQRGVNLVASWHANTRLFSGCSRDVTAAFCSTPEGFSAAIFRFGRGKGPEGSRFGTNLAET